jgi:WD40 repeat protein
MRAELKALLSAAVLVGSSPLLVATAPGDESIRTFIGHTGDIEGIAFAPDGRTALTASQDNTVKLWDLATGKDIRTFKGNSSGDIPRIYSVAFAPDGRSALSGAFDTLSLWDVTTGKEIRSFYGARDFSYVQSVAFAPDGRTALSGSWTKDPNCPGEMCESEDGRLLLWDVATGKLVRSFGDNLATVYSVAFAPDGRTVLSAIGLTVKLWDVSTGKELRTFCSSTGAGSCQSHSSRITSVAFAPDGRTAVSGSWDQTLKLWDVATGKEVRTFTNDAKLTSVAFAPDGHTLLSGDSHLMIKLWEVETGHLVHGFKIYNPKGHPITVYDVLVAFAPDGRTALSASGDVLKLWNIGRGE